MPPLCIKICGLSTPETVDAAIAGGASHVGFVHFAASPRHLPIQPIAALVAHASGRARTVVVTVDPDDATVAAIAERARPHAIQLHGDETPERVAAVREATGLSVVKSLSVRVPADLDRIAAYRRVADRLLLDARRPAGSTLPGGNGVAFDWSLLAAIEPGTPYFLAGGLDAGNVGEALATGACGLDISSGVESGPGIKDAGRMAAFFAALNEALNQPPAPGTAGRGARSTAGEATRA